MNTRPRILIVASEFPPVRRNYTRTLKFAKFLAESGCSVHVLTIPVASMESVVAGSEQDIPSNIKVGRITYPNPFRSVANPQPSRQGIFFKISSLLINFARKHVFIPDERMSWIPFAVRAGKKICHTEGIQVVYSSIPSYSNHVIARKIARAVGLPWVADYRDPWTRGEGRLRYTNWRTRLESRMERRLLRNMSRIIVATEGIKTALKQGSPSDIADKIEVIHNGYDLDDFAGIPHATDERYFTLAYTGVIYDDYNIDRFLSAVAEARAANPQLRQTLRVRFVGAIVATEMEKMNTAIERCALQDVVQVCPPVSRREALEIQRSSDVLLLRVNDDLAAEGALTSKLFDYVAAGKPVLALVKEGTAIADFVEKSSCGVIADLDDPESVRASLELLHENYFVQKNRLRANSDYIGKFDRRVLTGKLLAAITDLLQQNDSAMG